MPEVLDLGHPRVHLPSDAVSRAGESWTAERDAPDLAEEQAYLDAAYEALASMELRTAAAVADAAERAPGDWDATVAHRHLSARLSTLSESGSPLCFGRIDEEEAGNRWHIGRRHVEDDVGAPLVVDWRAPVAVPFYRATYRDPLGLWRRRRYLLDDRVLTDLVDERFDDPDASALAGAAGLPDPLLAELGRARTGTMRDIVATIAAEQDQVIRASLDRAVVVQGGPGTGKTAVGLHRAAWLLYEHRARLERDGVLVLGPNPIFLSYISQVLPSLGEVAVSQTTLAGLASAWRQTAGEEAAVAALKGSAVMAEVIARSAAAACRAPTEVPAVMTPWGSFQLSTAELALMLEEALSSGGTMQHRRSRFLRAVVRQVQRRASEREGALVDLEAVSRVLTGDSKLQAVLQRAWPSQSPAGLLRRLFGSERTLSHAAEGQLDGGERRLLSRRAARSVAAEPWTAADLPLLDEARALLTGVPRRYGHVVVDEAQDLSPMALRMVGRRSVDGRSFTILGDIAQATEPGAPRSWAISLEALGAPVGATVEVLTVGYRVPRPIMELANRLLAEVAPELPATDSVRPSTLSPAVVSAPGEQWAPSVAEEARELLSTYGSVAVITPPAALEEIRRAAEAAGLALVGPKVATVEGSLTVLSPELAKGLEFDAVIVAEPGDIFELPGGPGLLYIALTRAVQRLVVVVGKELPDQLSAVLG